MSRHRPRHTRAAAMALVAALACGLSLQTPAARRSAAGRRPESGGVQRAGAAHHRDQYAFGAGGEPREGLPASKGDRVDDSCKLGLC